MNPDTTTHLCNKTKAELLELADAWTKKHGPPQPSYNGAKNTLYGWTEDGKGVWILPMSKANSDRFDHIARSRPDLGHDGDSHRELMRLAGAEFFADWRDSDRARAAKEATPMVARAMEEDNVARDHS